ncbi:MAG: hypothetical protein ABR497_05755 [Kiritimatiellia bacterium]|nr:hypothetical protein [Lentisphaerota bacterium]
MTTLAVGFLLGLSKLACQIYAGLLPADAPLSGLTAALAYYGNINFLLFCVYLYFTG